MSEDRIPYLPTDKAQLVAKQFRIQELEHILRHFDGTSLWLRQYVESIDGSPDAEEWQEIRSKIEEMVDPYGGRNPNR